VVGPKCGLRCHPGGVKRGGAPAARVVPAGVKPGPEFKSLRAECRSRRGQQMRKNGRLFIILGVGLACLAVALAFLMFQNAGQSKAVEKPPTTVKVVTVIKDVPAHQVIRDTDLGDETVDKELLTCGEVFRKSDVLGQAANVGM